LREQKKRKKTEKNEKYIVLLNFDSSELRIGNKNYFCDLKKNLHIFHDERKAEKNLFIFRFASPKFLTRKKFNQWKYFLFFEKSDSLLQKQIIKNIWTPKLMQILEKKLSRLEI